MAIVGRPNAGKSTLVGMSGAGTMLTGAEAVSQDGIANELPTMTEKLKLLIRQNFAVRKDYGKGEKLSDGDSIRI